LIGTMAEAGGKPWRCHDSEYARHSERNREWVLKKSF
jgi:hypothetical protein